MTRRNDDHGWLAIMHEPKRKMELDVYLLIAMLGICFLLTCVGLCCLIMASAIPVQDGEELYDSQPDIEVGSSPINDKSVGSSDQAA